MISDGGTVLFALLPATLVNLQVPLWLLTGTLLRTSADGRTSCFPHELILVGRNLAQQVRQHRHIPNVASFACSPSIARTSMLLLRLGGPAWVHCTSLWLPSPQRRRLGHAFPDQNPCIRLAHCQPTIMPLKRGRRRRDKTTARTLTSIVMASGSILQIDQRKCKVKPTR